MLRDRRSRPCFQGRNTVRTSGIRRQAQQTGYWKQSEAETYFKIDFVRHWLSSLWELARHLQTQASQEGQAETLGCEMKLM